MIVFMKMVNKIDKENVLNTIKELFSAKQELQNFDVESVVREDVVKAIEELNECINKYNAILELLEKVDTSSKEAGKLLGGN